MVKPIPLEEAFGDSPAFRKKVQAGADAVSDLDSTLKRMVKLQNEMKDLQNEYSVKASQFAEELLSLAKADDDPAYELVALGLAKFSQTLKDLERSRQIMGVQMKDVFFDPVTGFTDREIAPAKKLGKEFQSLNDAYENALSRYSSFRPKDTGIETAAADVAKARMAFHAKTLAYSNKLNEVEVKRKYEVVENVMALIYTNYSFFHQSYDALKDIEPTMRDLTGMLQKMRSDYSQIDTKASMEAHLTSTPQYLYNPLNPHPPPGEHPTDTHGPQVPGKTVKTANVIHKGGYLFKKGSSKMRTVWNRRYFELINGSLYYFSEQGKGEEKTTIDLRICMVREIQNPQERRFCFELVSPAKSYTLQAENQEEMEDWLAVLQTAIARSISEEGQTLPAAKPTFGELDAAEMAQKDGGHIHQSDLLERVKTVPGNDKCADCASTEGVDWASCNLGIVLCITCSGMHRGLGRDFSKIRSLVLDRWDAESQEIMLALGNDRVNSVFEARLKRDATLEGDKPKPDSDRLSKQRFAFAKYAKKAYVRVPGDENEFTGTPIQTLLSEAVQSDDYPTVLKLLAVGADVNEKDLSGKSGLHRAIQANKAAMAEFLMLWNCDVNEQDEASRTPLHYAVEKGDLNMVMMLMKRSARTDVADRDGQVPLDIAKEHEDEGENYIKIVAILALKSSQQFAKKPGKGALSTSTDFQTMHQKTKPSPLSSQLPPSQAGSVADMMASPMWGTPEPSPKVLAPASPKKGNGGLPVMADEQLLWAADQEDIA
ncbi:Arf-GAP with coiled-coil, ANK repeat and PH domain-containing protein 2 [Rhizophlyctis rosea]|uniref:Arf-GAP with coiled-coil, ANK repeat and PH domain-containing protein 2 n=1 Tax=Rhizophlyctis rosea TaxID=64517 RepID=A0AAD5SA48_9FUNG|nr:Arf-GAP with coiled-coil, ANK repeat and PH domain-containing protein 2 [Rhizophlyctis rosea]